MPRPSRAALTTAPVAFLRRLEPPSDLTGLERQIWLETVAAAPSEFQPEDNELLRCYCVAAAQFRRATEMVSAGDVRTGLPLQAASSAMLMRAATRLRLGPRGRRPNGTRVSGGKSEPSAYDMLPPTRVKFKGFKTS
jgi:hypothetical protein